MAPFSLIVVLIPMGTASAFSHAPCPAFVFEPALPRPVAFPQSQYLPASPSTTLTSSGFSIYPTPPANSSNSIQFDLTNTANVTSNAASTRPEVTADHSQEDAMAMQPESNATNLGDDFAIRRARKAEENHANTARDTQRVGFHPDGFNQPMHCPPNQELGYMILDCKDCGGGWNYGNGAFENLWRCNGVSRQALFTCVPKSITNNTGVY